MRRDRAARLLLCWLVAVGFGTFYPFIPVRGSALAIGPGFWKLRPILFDVVDNLLLFMPLGLLLRAAGEGVAASLILGALLSGAIELGQLGFQYRIASFQDVLLNVVSSVLGTLLYARLAPRMAALDRLGVRRAMTALAIVAVAASASPPIVTPALWLWDEKATFRMPEAPAEELVPSHELGRVEVFASARSPATLTSPVWRKDATASATVTRAILAAGGFTVDMDVAPRSPPGNDLVIVLSYTTGPPRRSFGVAFDEGVVLFGMSTRVTTWYGALPSGDVPFRSPVLPAGPHRVTLSYDGETIRAFLDGEVWTEKRIELPPHNGLRKVWLAWSPGALWIYGFAVGFFVAAAGAAPGRARRAALVGMATGLLVELAQAVMFARWPDLRPITATVIGALGGAWLTRCASAVEPPA